MTEDSRVEYDLPLKALEALSQGDRIKAIEQVQLERNMSREEARKWLLRSSSPNLHCRRE